MLDLIVVKLIANNIVVLNNNWYYNNNIIKIIDNFTEFNMVTRQKQKFNKIQLIGDYCG